jgi:hypothetical protein
MLDMWFVMVCDSTDVISFLIFCYFGCNIYLCFSPISFSNTIAYLQVQTNVGWLLVSRNNYVG